MFTMLGSPRRCCDGITRRETLKAGALSTLGGFGLPQFLEAAENGFVRPGQAKSVILLYLLGGAATQDMLDLKPHAPQESRSPFKPIATQAPGIEVCEHLPRMARWMRSTPAKPPPPPRRPALRRPEPHAGPDLNGVSRADGCGPLPAAVRRAGLHRTRSRC